MSGSDRRTRALVTANSGNITGLVRKASAVSEQVTVRKSDYSIYQAVITNPVDVALTNEQIAIYISFDRGECKNEACIELYDGSTLVPFQWEADVHPNPKIAEDFGTYADTTLKNGTIWFLGSLSVGQTKTYTIKVYEKDRSNSYATPVQYNIIDGTTTDNRKEELLANSVAIRLHENLGWLIRYVYVSGVEMVGGIVFQRAAITNNAYATIDSNVFANLSGVSRSVSGSGVVFKDFISTFSYAYNTNIVVTSKIRMWANGKFDVNIMTRTIADIASGVLNAVNFKISMQKVGEVAGTGYKGIKSGSTSLLSVVKYFQYIPDGNTNAYPAQLLGSNDASFTYLFTFWANTNPTTFAIPKDSYYSSSYHFTGNVDVANSTSLTNAINTMRNAPRTTATKHSSRTLKSRLVGLSKAFVLLNADKAQTETAFPLLNALVDLTRNEINGVDGFTNSLAMFKAGINSTYGGGTATSIYATYPARGIEYLGRDMSAIKYFKAKCVRQGLMNEVAYFNSLIHAVADTFVSIEAYSGGGGNVYLSSTVFDNMNAEACAMHFIKQSLDVIENTTRRACYNRIKARFEGGLLYKNILPYSIGQEVITQQISHYHGFSTYDYVQAVDTPSYHTYNYIMDYNTPSGFTKEIGYSYTNSRWGFVHTAFYAAFVLYKAGTISTLQQACAIVEHIVSRCYPNGYHEYPLDGWTPNQASYVSIEIQIVCQIVLEELLFS